MILDLFSFDHPQVQHASTPIGCLKELLNYHWLLLKTSVEIANILSKLDIIIDVIEWIVSQLGVVTLLPLKFEY